MPPKKKIAALVKVQLQAGAATPAPPVGTALGPHGVNIMDFCKAYNAATESMRGTVIPVDFCQAASSERNCLRPVFVSEYTFTRRPLSD